MDPTFKGEIHGSLFHGLKDDLLTTLNPCPKWLQKMAVIVRTCRVQTKEAKRFGGNVFVHL